METSTNPGVRARNARVPRPGKSSIAALSRPAAPTRHDGLALEVLGKFREIFRAAKLPAAASERKPGVTAAELWALAELHRHPGARVSDLTALLSLRQSTVSNLVEKLAQAKLVRRVRNDDDRRVVRLYLTRAGERLLGRAPESARGVLPDALERLPRAELRHLDAQLTRLLGAMSDRIPTRSRANGSHAS